MNTICSLRRALLMLSLLQGISPGPARGQECATLSDSARIAWERDARDRRRLIDRVVSLAREEGAERPEGLVLVATDAQRHEVRVRYVGLNLPERVHLHLRGMLAGILEERPVERRALVVEFGAPEIPLESAVIELCSPRLRNRLRIQYGNLELRERHPTFERAEDRSPAEVGLLIDSEGRVRYAELENPTGDLWLDQRLPLLAREMKFVPARVNGTPVPSWTTRRMWGLSPKATREPALENADEVARLLGRMYPEAAKQGGIGARVVLWLQVDATGVVREVEVRSWTMSPHDAVSHALDFVSAARRVAHELEYRPATEDGEPMAAWIVQPITFAVR